MKCDSCQMLMINGVPCHETGCPNALKVWNGEEWVYPPSENDEDDQSDEVMSHDLRIEAAKERGHQAGLNAKAAGYAADWSPLSGEWAGESIPELLGDLLPDGYQDEEILDAYEDAALEAFQQEKDA